MEILTTVLTVVEMLTKAAPVIIQAGADLKPFAAAIYAKFKGTAITPTEQTALEAGIDALYARLQIPLPAAQPGDADYVAPGQ